MPFKMLISDCNLPKIKGVTAPHSPFTPPTTQPPTKSNPHFSNCYAASDLTYATPKHFSFVAHGNVWELRGRNLLQWQPLNYTDDDDDVSVE